MIKKPRRPAQEINSSSMADIAFLLLVFFLVTTTISMDKGISLVLPAEGNELEVNKNNIVNILVNESGRVLIDDQPIIIKNIANLFITYNFLYLILYIKEPSHERRLFDYFLMSTKEMLFN